MSAPAPTPKLELLVCATIREHVERGLRWRVRDGETEPYLQGGVEMRVWREVERVIEEAGWQIKRRDGEQGL